MLGRDEIIDRVDQNISELVVHKYKTKKAYDYYNCIIDTEQFRYLEENYGIGNPSSVKFVPLIKKHIDAMVGEHLEVPLMPTTSCKDNRTISNILRDKQLSLKSKTKWELVSRLKNWLSFGVTGKLEDNFIREQLERLKRENDMSFISEYEIATQNVVKWIIQSKQIDIYEKRRQLMTDFLTAGECFYSATKTPDGNGIGLNIHSPMNVFPQRNPDSNYVKDCSRIVVRKWMTKDEVINKFNKYLNRETIEQIEFEYKAGLASYNETLVRVNAPDGKPTVPQHIGDDSTITPGFPEEGMRWYSRFIPVYYCEWIETEKVDGKYKMNRYHAYRIGESIHIPLGIDHDAIRSIDDPTTVKLSINGLFLRNRQNQPFSLVLKCADLQDQFNIAHYIKNNMIANGGVVGDYVDLAKLPVCLGADWAERLEKLIAYKKQGVAPFDSSQDGTPMVNTMFNGYDDTVKVQAIQAIIMATQDIENTVSGITGISRERLANGIQQYDSVRNVQAGIRNSYSVTRHYYEQMDCLDADILLDLLNQAKVAYKDGIQGEIILGNMKKTFTALPKHYAISDFDVHLPSSTKILEDMEMMRSAVGEFIKSGKYEPDIILEAMTAKSATELKANITQAYNRKKEEENLIGKLQQKIQEYEQQLQQLSGENKKLSEKNEQLNEQKMQLESQKMQLDFQIKQMIAKTDKTYKEGILNVEERKVNIEEAQLSDGNPYNNKAK